MDVLLTARLLQLAAVIEEQASVLYRYPGDPLPDTVADVLTDIARELREIAHPSPERDYLVPGGNEDID